MIMTNLRNVLTGRANRRNKTKGRKRPGLRHAHRCLTAETLEGRWMLSATWFEQDKVVGTTPGDEQLFGDQFGYSVAVDGDTMVVGSQREDVNGVLDAGAAYVLPPE